MGEALITRRGGGGVDISSATASPSDVLAGKTFFSGLSDLIQTGTFSPKNAIKFANGTAPTPSYGTSNPKISVSGLSFTPIAIIAYLGEDLSTAILLETNTNMYRCYYANEASGSVSSSYNSVVENGFSIPIRYAPYYTEYFTWYAIGF